MSGINNITIGIVKPSTSSGGNGFPIPFLDLKLVEKGSQNDIPNTNLNVLQIGDFVQGMKNSKTVWKSARYNGGDPSDRNNYTPIVEVIMADEYIAPVPEPIQQPDPAPEGLSPLIETLGTSKVTSSSFSLSALPVRKGQGVGNINSSIEIAKSIDFSDYLVISSKTLMELLEFTVNFNNLSFNFWGGGIKPNTSYYYRARMTTNPAYEGQTLWYGETKTVTTLP